MHVCFLLKDVKNCLKKLPKIGLMLLTPDKAVSLKSFKSLNFKSLNPFLIFLKFFL